MIEFYYFLRVQDGRVTKTGPFDTDEERDAAARAAARDAYLSRVEGVTFAWLDVRVGTGDDPVAVGDYTEAELSADSEDAGAEGETD